MTGRVITFYSYKGGVGRSFLMANVAAVLAKWNYRVLAIDWDLEAPGLVHYFRPWIKDERPGLVELLHSMSGPSSESGGMYRALPLESHSDQVTACAISPDTEWAASGSQDGALRVVGVAKRTTMLFHESSAISCCAFSAASDRLAVGRADGSLTVQNVGNDAIEALKLLPGGSQVRSCGFSVDGRWLAVGAVDGSISVWTTDRARVIWSTRVGCGGVSTLTFSSEGSRLVTGHDDGGVRVWAVDTGELIHAFESEGSPVVAVGLSRANDQLIAMDANGTLRTWNERSGVADPARTHILPGHIARAFSTDGSALLTSTAEGELSLWDSTTAHRRIRLEPSEVPITACAMSPDHRTWLTGDRNGSVTMWVRDETPRPWHATELSNRWRDHLTTVALFSPQASLGSLQVITAGKEGIDYARSVQALDWERLYAEHEMGEKLESLREQWKSEYDFVLIDSRTGISDIAGVTTIQMPDTLVFCFTANSQSTTGSFRTVERIIANRSTLPYDRQRLLCLPILSRFEQRIERAETLSWVERIEVESAGFFRDWLPSELTNAPVIQKTRVPAVPFWGFGERLPIIEDERSNGDPESVNQPIHNIAALLARDFQGVQQLIVSRDAFVASAVNTSKRTKSDEENRTQGPLSGVGIRVFVSGAKTQSLLTGMLLSEFAAREIETWSEVDITPGTNLQETLLEQLKRANVLILLLAGTPTEWQRVALENFFTLSVRDESRSLIVPVVCDDDAIHTLPSLLRQITVVEGRAQEPAEVVKRIVNFVVEHFSTPSAELVTA